MHSATACGDSLCLPPALPLWRHDPTRQPRYVPILVALGLLCVMTYCYEILLLLLVSMRAFRANTFVMRTRSCVRVYHAVYLVLKYLRRVICFVRLYYGFTSTNLLAVASTSYC